MSYIVIKYHSEKDENKIITELSSQIPCDVDVLKLVDRKLHRQTDKKPQDRTAEQLLIGFIQLDSKRGFEIVKAKNELKSDINLISAAKDNYLGYVSKSWTKEKILNAFLLKSKKMAFDFLRSNTNKSLPNFHKISELLNLTGNDSYLYFQMVENNLTDAQNWVDQKAADTLRDYSNLGQMVIRNF